MVGPSGCSDFCLAVCAHLGSLCFYHEMQHVIAWKKEHTYRVEDQHFENLKCSSDKIQDSKCLCLFKLKKTKKTKKTPSK